jgi:diguanylate cyclase (GGDEF)-like protein
MHMLHTHPSPNSPGINKRRHDRHSVVQRVTLSSTNRETACVIRDFCEGGVFMEGVEHQGHSDLCHTSVGEPVVIRFAAQGGIETYRLVGRIAHVSGRGVGVAFLEPPPVGALSALQEQSARTSAAVPDRAGNMSEADDALRGNCIRVLDEALREVLADFFGQIEPALINAAQQAETNAIQGAYFDAATLLKVNRTALERDFLSRVREHAEHMADGQTPWVQSDPATPTEGLSLVDNQAFEDWLNLSEQVVRLEHEHEEAICTLERRFSTLVRRGINHKNNPYGPSVLGHAFRASLSGWQLNNSARRVLYSVFVRALNARSHALYQRLEEITRDIAPVAPADRTRRTAAPRKDRARTEDSGGESIEANNPSPGPGVLTGLPRTVQGAAALLDLCARMSALRPNAAGDGEGTRLTQAVGQHEQSVGTLEALFDAILSEQALSPGLKPYFRQLQVPLLQAAAAADPTLLLADVHPARETLNLLDHLAIAINPKGDLENQALRESLDGIIQRISREAGRNPAVFAEVNEQLARMTASLLRAKSLRMERVREACEGNQRIEHARQRTAQEVDSRLAGKRVPTIVPELLDGGWRQLLVLTFLRQGAESEDWRQQLSVLDRLLNWLSSGEESVQPSIADVHELIDFVDTQLVTVSPDQTVHNRIVDELTALLLGVGIPRQKRPPRLIVMSAAQAYEDASPLDQAGRAQLERFRVGDWFHFSSGPGVWQPLRLTWIGERPERYVFVNRKGGKEMELGPEELIRQLNERRAVKIASLDLPLMERTANSLMESMQERLRYQASHDPVTGLINRKEFMRRLDRQLAGEHFVGGQRMLGLIEVDQFRVITSLCGMEAGDQLLREICAIVGQTLNGEDLLARMGDSRFGLLFAQGSVEDGLARAEELVRAVKGQHFKWGSRSFSVGINIGMIACTPGRSDVNALINSADAACLASREKGRNLIHRYAEDDASLEARKILMDWAGRIDSILEEDRLFARCQLIQPIFPERGLHSHYEVLLGIRDEQGDFVSPADFVPAAERWKRISEIDRWLIRSVFGWIRCNPERFRKVGGFSINLSGQSLNSDDFLDFLHDQFAAGDVPLEKVTFEITETAAIDEFKQAEKFIRQIKRYGCKFSLDDFGSGFSSYAYLKNLQVDYLKIDGSFVKDLVSSSSDYLMVKSMNEIGHSLGMRTIAEYVETDAILDKLREIGVDYAQGFGVRKPVPLEDVI